VPEQHNLAQRPLPRTELNRSLNDTNDRITRV
jgi:hypothetical protein